MPRAHSLERARLARMGAPPEPYFATAGCRLRAVDFHSRMHPAERKAQASVRDEWYRWMVQSVTGYAMFSTDLQGRILTWDEGAEELFGYRRDDVKGENARFIF